MAERRTRPPGWRAPSSRAAPPSRGVADTAERLARLLLTIPLAARPGGASVEELAERLGVDEATVLSDLRELEEHSYATPAGSGDAVQLLTDGRRIQAWTPADFRRPVRLSAREALALGLALRLAALSPASEEGHPEAREKLRRRLEAGLAIASAEGALERLAAPELEPGADGVQETMHLAVRERRPCIIRYLKPGDAAPEDRRVHPYALVHGEGSWYVLGYCESAGAVRSFRTDRVVGAMLHEGPLHEEPDFDPYAHVAEGRVYSAHDDTEAVVRYSPRVARWIAEREEGRWQEDGALHVTHRVADPVWLVRHVLRYAGEAEVVEPAALREAVAEAAARAGGRHGAGR